jgi:hypothetical protein
MSASHTSNIYHRLQGRVKILPAMWVANWMNKCASNIHEDENKTMERAKLTQQVTEWRKHQVIAYPVHSPNYWTMGMVVNLARSEKDPNHQKTE